MADAAAAARAGAPERSNCATAALETDAQRRHRHRRRGRNQSRSPTATFSAFSHLHRIKLFSPSERRAQKTVGAVAPIKRAAHFRCQLVGQMSRTQWRLFAAAALWCAAGGRRQLGQRRAPPLPPPPLPAKPFKARAPRDPISAEAPSASAPTSTTAPTCLPAGAEGRPSVDVYLRTSAADSKAERHWRMTPRRKAKG